VAAADLYYPGADVVKINFSEDVEDIVVIVAV